MRFQEDAADARHYSPPSQGAMDRIASIPAPADIQSRDFELLLPAEQHLTTFVKACIIQTETHIPGREIMSWTYPGEGATITPEGNLWRITMHAEPARLDYFGDLFSVKPPREIRDGWTTFDDGTSHLSDGNPVETIRVRWIPSEPRQYTRKEEYRCTVRGCETTKSPRWALGYLVEDVGYEIPTTGVVLLYCQSCVTSGAECTEFHEQSE